MFEDGAKAKEEILLSQTTEEAGRTPPGEDRDEVDGDTGYDGWDRSALGRGEDWSTVGSGEEGATGPATFGPPRDMGLSCRHLTVT